MQLSGIRQQREFPVTPANWVYVRKSFNIFGHPTPSPQALAWMGKALQVGDVVERVEWRT